MKRRLLSDNVRCGNYYLPEQMLKTLIDNKIHEPIGDRILSIQPAIMVKVSSELKQ